jgi:PEP-CTERM motif
MGVPSMRTKLHTLLVGTSCALLPLSAFADISFLSGVSLPNGGEITSYATDGSVLATDSIGGGSANHAVQSYTLTSGGTLTTGAAINLNSVFGTAADINSVSSVLNDIRGFGVATIIPTVNTEGSLGRIAIFDKSNGSILKTLDVGYHPDSVTITPDGSKLLIANEGEFVSTAADATFARPGSVSVVNISGVTSGNYTTVLAGLTAGAVTTYDFTAGNLGSGVTIDGLRNSRLDTSNVKSPNAADIEPEYITATNTTAYITLQENNAIAALDLATGKYTAIHDLGSITKAIDASDTEAAINVNDVVRGLPMPDAITKFERDGRTLLVTANEGDARGDDGDTMRVKQEGTSGRPAIDPTVEAALNAQYGGDYKADNALGRLNILKDQGDTDLDGDIDQITALGTRSFSIFDAETGELVFDSGSMIEEFVAANDPTTFNINSGNLGTMDTRSDDKGPEVEALAFGSIDGQDFVFVGAERQNGIFQFNITDLENVFIAGYYNPISGTDDSGGAFISPESIVFIGAGDNPTGKNILLVGFEGTGGNGSLGVFEVTASAIPEPSTFAALAGLGALGLAGMRRRRA